ncbi:MAG: ATP-binding protein [Pirellulales bacterium]|jgi:serine/threonine-protein kinase RsbW
MTDHAWNWSIEKLIPSIPAEGKRIVDDLLAKLSELGWEEHDVFGIHLAVEEALVNAIKHGNQDNPEKFVDVNLKLSSEKFFIQVTDQGAGFNPMDVPDPTDDDNIDLPSGRGLMLMRSFMTLVEYNATGNSVTMAKDRTHL